jgi:hypothetical protein
MELRPSWEAANCSATQELPSVLWNPKVYYRPHESPPLVPILSQIDPIPTIPSYLSKINIVALEWWRISLRHDLMSMYFYLHSRWSVCMKMSINDLKYSRYFMDRKAEIPKFSIYFWAFLDLYENLFYALGTESQADRLKIRWIEKPPINLLQPNDYYEYLLP